MRLKELQTFLYRRIAAPGRESQGRRGKREGALPEIESVIRSEAGLDALERVEIYAGAYFQRLLECLKEDFPATLTVAGEVEFGDLVHDYLAEYPLTEPSIDWAGRHFPRFLCKQPILSRFPFLVDLARLEWAISEVFVAPDCEALSADELQSLPAERWPALALLIRPASQILECEWRVSFLRRAIENGEQWSNPAPGPTSILVWRQAGEVYFRELETAEGAALKVASKGATFAELCEAFAARLRDENPVEAINRMFAGWIADGLLAGPATIESPAIRARRKNPLIGRKER